MLIVPATEAPAEPQMHLLKASLRPWPPQRVSGGTREAGRKSGARVQDTGFCSSNVDCRRRGHWTLRTPGRTHRAVSGDGGGVVVVGGGEGSTNAWKETQAMECAP